MLKKCLHICFFVFCGLSLKAQLVINELSQGPSGTTSEYVEFVVIGTSTCTDSCANLQGWVLDDNCGFYGGSGIATGHIRFSTDPQWQCVAYGTIILIYNPASIYPGIVIDETDANNDNVYVLPSTSSYFESDASYPASGTSISSYAGSSYSAGGIAWAALGMSNGNDAFHSVDPSNLTAGYHSVAWGSSTGADILFSGSASSTLFQNENLVDDNPFSQANWASQNESLGTPGAGNNTANTAWINTMQNSVSSEDTTISETICDGDSFFFDNQYLHTLGTYYDTLTTSSGCDSIVTLNLNVEICADCSMDLGNDTLICGPVNYTLDAGIFDEYLWQDNSTNQTLTATTTGQYWCQAISYDTANLIVNPGFESGDVNFTTQYTPGTGGAWGLLTNPGEYAITTSPSLVHNNFVNCADHTSGSGNMFVANGSNSPNTDAWCQTITVTPNTDYVFSAWTINADGVSTMPSQMAELRFLVDGTPIGSTFSPSVATCNWTQHSATWNSASNTSISICIENTNFTSGGAGADFALDDIFFGKLCITSDTINILNTPSNVLFDTLEICFNDSVSIFGEMQSNSGAYFDTLTSVNGCDSLYYQTNLIVGDSLYSVLDTAICFSDSIFLEGAWQNTSNTYYDTLQSTTMCDSLIVTNLMVSVAPVTDTTQACTNILADEGISIVDTLYTNIGCDSVYNYLNTVYQATDSTTNTSCTNDPLLAGTTIDTAMNTLGCDSFYTITQVTYLAPVSIILIDSCTNNPSDVLNQIDTLYTSLSCDSVYNYSIITLINPDTLVQTQCTNDATLAGISYTNTSSASGCDSFTVALEIIYVPYDTVILPTMSICEGETELILGNTESQSDTYSELITSALGCDSIWREQTLIVNDLPIVSAGQDTTISEGENVVLIATGANTYTWSNGETSSIQDLTLTETTNFSVLGVDTNNCQDQDSITVFVLTDEVIMALPTAFTPNGDEVNDVFRIVNHESFENITMRVYNRWGEMVFLNDKNLTSWDGKYKNVDQPVDNYIYYIEAIAKKTQEKFSVSGSISLIR